MDAPPLRRPHLPGLVRALAIALLVLAACGVLWTLGTVLDKVHNTATVVVFAVLFAYVIYPAVQWLVKRRVPVAAAGLVVYAAIFLVIGGAIAWLAPSVIQQSTDLAHNAPGIIANVKTQIANPSSVPLLAKLPPQARQAIAENASKAGTIGATAASSVGPQAIAILSGTGTTIINTALMLGVTLLLIGDLAQIQAFGMRMVPARNRMKAAAFVDDVDRVIGGFVRGQLVLAIGVGIVGTLILLVIGVPFALLIGLIAGLLSIIPLVGPIVAIVPVVLIALVTVGWVKALIVLVLFGIVVQVQQALYSPFLAKSIGVTPLVVFVSLLFGSEAFGILGGLLAIPLAGILRVAADWIFPASPEASNAFALAREAAGASRHETRETIEKTEAGALRTK